MTTPSLTAPTARAVDFPFTHLGRDFVDPYRWLHDKNDPDVIAYLEAENAFAKATLAHTNDLQETLYQEMFGRMPQDDSSAPEKRGSNYYYWRTESGKQYKIFCRKQGSLDAPEEILLDENVLAEGLDYCKVRVLEPSPDQKYAAYAVDVTGAWVFDLYVINMDTKEIVSGPIHETAWSFAWASDSQTLFYTLFDEMHRAYKLMRHTVGSDPDSDVLVFHEPDDAFTMDISRTRSGAYLLMTLQSHTQTEVHILPADKPTTPIQIIEPRRPKIEYYVEHQGDHFLIWTNEDAVNFRLMTAPVNQPSRANWQEMIPHRSDVLIEGVSAFRDVLVVYERRGGLQQIRYSNPSGADVRYVEFPEYVYALQQASNPEYDTSVLRFGFSSLITPESIVDYDLVSLQWHTVKQQQIPSGYDGALYESVRLSAPAPDGAQVPLSVVYRKGTPLDGSAPLLLYAYGSYGFSTEPSFDFRRLSLLDRGFVYAIAHIRGGSELGRDWYESGRLMNKKNTFTDFIAAGEHLINTGYTSREKLAIMGGSAGGLLVTAVTNMRPDLFRAVVAMVPFTNVITAMLDPTLPLTIPEYEQWGNPHEQEAFDYMLSYSPYDNLEAKDYPNIYVKTGINDLQVPYWDPAKYVARLRSLKTDSNRLLLVTNMGAGHGGASGRYDYLREYAQVYAFLIDTLGAPVEPL